MANSEAGERIGRAGLAGRENLRKKKQEKEKKRMLGAGYPASHRVRVKVRYTEVRK